MDDLAIVETENPFVLSARRLRTLIEQQMDLFERIQINDERNAKTDELLVKGRDMKDLAEALRIASEVASQGSAPVVDEAAARRALAEGSALVAQLTQRRITVEETVVN